LGDRTAVNVGIEAVRGLSCKVLGVVLPPVGFEAEPGEGEVRPDDFVLGIRDSSGQRAAKDIAAFWADAQCYSVVNIRWQLTQQPPSCKVVLLWHEPTAASVTPYLASARTMRSTIGSIRRPRPSGSAATHWPGLAYPHRGGRLVAGDVPAVLVPVLAVEVAGALQPDLIGWPVPGAGLVLVVPRGRDDGVWSSSGTVGPGRTRSSWDGDCASFGTKRSTTRHPLLLLGARLPAARERLGLP
jgi:hypothetical protein